MELSDPQSMQATLATGQSDQVPVKTVKRGLCFDTLTPDDEFNDHQRPVALHNGKARNESSSSSQLRVCIAKSIHGAGNRPRQVPCEQHQALIPPLNIDVCISIPILCSQPEQVEYIQKRAGLSCDFLIPCGAIHAQRRRTS